MLTPSASFLMPLEVIPPRESLLAGVAFVNFSVLLVQQMGLDVTKKRRLGGKLPLAHRALEFFDNVSFSMLKSRT